MECVNKMKKLILVPLVFICLALQINPVHADKPEHAKEYAYNSCVLLCENDCDVAKAALSNAESACYLARNECSVAEKDCTKSIEDAKESCLSGCDQTKVTAYSLCETDPTITASCMIHATEAHNSCLSGCRNASYHTSECVQKVTTCNAVKPTCDAIRPAQIEKNTQCSRLCKNECKG